MNILVLSTYDLTPVRDGGQTRYVNLYLQIAERHRVTVLCYDYRRQAGRRYALGERFEVLAPRCHAADLRRFQVLMERTGRHLHDLLCIREHRFSDEFLAAARHEAARADVVVASHPYLAPLVFGYCGRRTVKIYESHNVEFDAKAAYFAGDPDRVLRRLLDDVRQAERLACVEADYVTAVSDADADRLAELYRIARRKITTIANGVDSARYPLLTPDEKAALRRRLGADDRPLAVFLGSGHAPNVDAYLRTRALLTQAGFTGLVVAVGSVGDALPTPLGAVPFEETFLGHTDEAAKCAIVGAADFALQLIFTGSGTNLKLFDYMASRTLIVANEFGRRGVRFDGWCWPVDTADDLAGFLLDQPWLTPAGRQIAARARQIAEQHYDWRRIAAAYLRLLALGRGTPAAGDSAASAAAAASTDTPPGHGAIDRAAE